MGLAEAGTMGTLSGRCLRQSASNHSLSRVSNLSNNISSRFHSLFSALLSR
jgi:hypothetical protein